jgi:hypothetical protein
MEHFDVLTFLVSIKVLPVLSFEETYGNVLNWDELA